MCVAYTSRFSGFETKRRQISLLKLVTLLRLFQTVYSAFLFLLPVRLIICIFRLFLREAVCFYRLCHLNYLSQFQEINGKDLHTFYYRSDVKHISRWVYLQMPIRKIRDVYILFYSVTLHFRNRFGKNQISIPNILNHGRELLNFLYQHDSKIYQYYFWYIGFSSYLLKEIARLITGQHDKTGEIHKVRFGSDQPNLVSAL